jgi:excisionase family DNA binding protein
MYLRGRGRAAVQEVNMNAALLTVEDAAQALSLSRAKTYQLIQRDELRSVTIGRSRRVPAIEIERYIARLLGDNETTEAAVMAAGK